MTKKAAGKAPAKDGIAALSSIDDLMAMALAMESEAAERYAEFAEVMEAHNNREVAELFGKMARIENLHAQQIRDKMGWTDAPPGGARAYRWEGMEGPETGDHGELHYLMTPHHALKIARMNEQRAHRFYEKLVASAPAGALRAAAEEMLEEEAEHVRLMDDWLARTPAPSVNWSEDLDPPNYHD